MIKVSKSVSVIFFMALILHGVFMQAQEPLPAVLKGLQDKLGGLKEKLHDLSGSLGGLKKALNPESSLTPLPSAAMSNEQLMRYYPFTGEIGDEKDDGDTTPEGFSAAFARYFKNHQLDLVRLEKFEKALAVTDQATFSSKTLEVFFDADSNEEFDTKLEPLKLPTSSAQTDFDDVLKGLKSAEKNTIREKLAKKWIRNAAVRVFADDLRSFLELVVNSCDACMPASASTGKFGMGFFSILSLLGFKETGGATIAIDTNYNVGFGMEGYTLLFEKTGDLGEWGADDDIKVAFAKKKEADLANAVPGTTITITPKDAGKKFSNETQEAVRKYVYYMHQYPHVLINLKYQGKEESVNKEALEKANPVIVKTVKVIVSADRLAVADEGSGIPLKTALLKLLVPSSSTKSGADLTKLRQEIESKEPELPELVARAKDAPGGDQSRMIMTVNNVTVVSKTIPTIKDASGSVCDLILPLPQVTQLTLARDDLEIHPDGHGFEEKHLKRVVDETIQKVFGLGAKKDSSVQGNAQLLMSLYNGLRAWEDASAAQHIKGRFSGHVKSQIEDVLADPKNQNLVPVPAAHAEVFGKMFPGGTFGDKKLLVLDESLVNYNFSRLEELLHQTFLVKAGSDTIKQDAAQEKLIQGQKVYFTDKVTKIETLGLKGVLFVPESLFVQGKREETCGSIQSMIGDIILLGEDDELPDSPPLIIDTYVDGMVTKLADGRRFFEQTQEDLLRAYISKDASFKVRLKDSFEQSKESIFKDFAEDISKNFKSSNRYYLSNGPNEKKSDQPDIGLGFIESLENAYTQNLSFFSDEIKISRLDFWNFVLSLVLYPYGYNTLSSQTADIYLYSTDKELRKIDEKIPENFYDFWFEESKEFWLDSTEKNNYDKISLKSFAYLYLGLYPPHTTRHCTKHLMWERMFPAAHGVKIVNPISIFQKDADPKKIVTIFESMCTAVSKYTSTFLSVFDSISPIYTSFLQISELHEKVIETAIDEKIRQRIDGMVAITQGLFDQYLRIDPNELSYNYGGVAHKKVLQTSLPDVTAAQLMEFFRHVSDQKDQELLSNLFVFQNIDFAFQTNINLRKEDLSQNKLYFPSMLSNTPCSLLVRVFFDSGRNADLVKTIIKKTANPEELNFVCYLLLAEKNKKFITDAAMKAQLPQSVGNLIENFIRERVDQEEIRELYLQNRVGTSLDDRLKNIAKKSIVDLVHDYLDQSLNQKVFFQTVASEPRSKLAKDKVKDSEIWLLSKLMRAHTKGTGIHDDLIAGNIDNVAKKVKNIKKSLDVGKIMQAVEAGSEKSPIEASIVECLQNSADAIRGYFKKLEENKESHSKRENTLSIKDGILNQQIATIDYELSKVTKDVDHDHMLLTMRDHVGMPGLEVLLTDLILPDYSNKSRAQGNVGDMGNGTFKLYQDATSVTFVTRSVRDPKKVFMLLVEPLRNEHGLVYDLQLRCCDVSEEKDFEKFFGTEISVIFRSQKKESNNLQIFQTRDFLRNCCGSTNVEVLHDGKTFEVVLNLKEFDEETETSSETRINPKPALIWKHTTENEKLKKLVPDETTLFTAVRRAEQQLQSYVTTSGVPFRPLRDIVKQLDLLPNNLLSLINEGVIVDLALGTYQPVQSRTQIKMPPDVEQELMQELAKCCREVVFQEGVARALSDENKLNAYFTHYLSPADPAQLLPSATGAEELEKAFKAKDSFIPFPTFFRFYKSLIHLPTFFIFNGSPLPEDKQPVKNFANLLLNYLGVIFDKTSKYDGYTLLEDIVKKFDGKTASSDLEKKNKQKEFLEMQDGILNHYMKMKKEKFEEVEKACWSSLADAPSIQQHLVKIVSQWVRKKQDDFLKPEKYSLFDFFKMNPSLKTKSDEVKECSFSSKISMKSSKGGTPQGLKALLSRALDIYANELGIGKGKKVLTEFYVDPTAKLAGYWDSQMLKINLAYVPSIASQVDLVCTLLEGKTGKIASHSGYRDLYAVPLGEAPVIAHELEHARRTFEGIDAGQHDLAGAHDAIDGVSFDACALNTVKEATQKGLLKKWSDALRKKFPGIDVTALRDQVEVIRELEKEDKALLAQEILKEG